MPFVWPVSPVKSADQHVTGKAHPSPVLETAVTHFSGQAAALQFGHRCQLGDIITFNVQCCRRKAKGQVVAWAEMGKKMWTERKNKDNEQMRVSFRVTCAWLWFCVSVFTAFPSVTDEYLCCSHPPEKHASCMGFPVSACKDVCESACVAAHLSTCAKQMSELWSVSGHENLTWTVTSETNSLKAVIHCSGLKQNKKTTTTWTPGQQIFPHMHAVEGTWVVQNLGMCQVTGQAWLWISVVAW